MLRYDSYNLCKYLCRNGGEGAVNDTSEMLAEASLEVADEESAEEENLFLSAAKRAEKKKRRGQLRDVEPIIGLNTFIYYSR